MPPAEGGGMEIKMKIDNYDCKIGLEIINLRFSMYELTEYPNELLGKKYVFFSNTDNECSLLCLDSYQVKNYSKKEIGWRMFRFMGILDFSLIGILSSVLEILAEARISILSFSTYRTDYIFVRENDYNKAISVLKKNNYMIKMSHENVD